jgi:hypothetical protein
LVAEQGPGPEQHRQDRDQGGQDKTPPPIQSPARSPPTTSYDGSGRVASTQDAHTTLAYSYNGIYSRGTDGHISRDWFGHAIWNPAVKAAKIDGPVRMHDRRHGHASWLLAGGADLQVVKERLGHANIATTERYLHTLPTADDTALEPSPRSGVRLYPADPHTASRPLDHAWELSRWPASLA